MRESKRPPLKRGRRDNYICFGCLINVRAISVFSPNRPSFSSYSSLEGSKFQLDSVFFIILAALSPHDVHIWEINRLEFPSSFHFQSGYVTS